jgi:hypothetical protein
MPLKTLGPIGPRAVGERVNEVTVKKCIALFNVNNLTVNI